MRIKRFFQVFLKFDRCQVMRLDKCFDAGRDLADQAFKVRDALSNGELAEAREALSGIVGRDTANLDSKEIVRAVIETVAEGTLDGIVSPFIYAGIGGAPLVMAFKAVSTLDSMVGYKNEKYLLLH